MYEVIGHPSSRAFRVLWMLEEMGEAYTNIPAKPHSPEALDCNPSGKVPALRIDGQVITDSTAIMTYLADKHGQLTYPAGTIERARQDAATHQIIDELDAVLWMATRHKIIHPENRRVPAVIDSLKWEYERNIGHIADRFVGPFVMGDKMTIADIILTNCLNWAFAAKFPAAPEKLTAYAKAMRSRDAYKRATGKP
ncbi:glutathione S-transferase family protein [Thalassovita aquimarina]|uniref:Glutathione S-transferase family protein n=1 Tax=Thalassovita aquimarina TaxID=2785917 RepID=A0ABS5HNS6_9RHOB|nr:glutathione S-transferase family protein [Thalassovita aquimarina]MBR9650573.1 glutathione S-transferase family protein [Thalassovita aquimarina]